MQFRRRWSTAPCRSTHTVLTHDAKSNQEKADECAVFLFYNTRFDDLKPCRRIAHVSIRRRKRQGERLAPHSSRWPGIVRRGIVIYRRWRIDIHRERRVGD